MTLPRILQSLKLQISIAIASLTILFAASILYSLHVIDQQHSDDVLVQLAGQLQFNQQRLTVQAMRYQENAPRDYPSYFRDLRLYFEDQKKTRAEMNRIIEAFATNRFDSSLIGETMRMPPQLPERWTGPRGSGGRRTHERDDVRASHRRCPGRGHGP